jgi:hypothetical protein
MQSPKFAQLSEQEIEVYRALLDEPYPIGIDRTYFITCTPMNAWGDLGDWITLPESLHVKVQRNSHLYLPAHEAMFREGHVLDVSTSQKAWMRWITITKWISDSEVEIETGIWSCPLGGGGRTEIWEKIDGAWKKTKSLNNWVS